MSTSNHSLPLPQFLHATLLPLVGIFNDDIPSHSPRAQTILNHALDELYLIARMISSLGLYSDNEDAEEMGERELLFMAVGWVVGEVENRVDRGKVDGSGQGGVKGRMDAIGRADNAYQTYLHLVSTYKVLTPEEAALSGAYAESGLAPAKDPARRREEKIRAYKREKELRAVVASSLPDIEPSSSPLSFILHFLPPPSSTPSDNLEQHRPAILSLLRLLHTLSLASLSSNHMEREILRSAPFDGAEIAAHRAASTTDSRSSQRETDSTWRLDRPDVTRASPRELISGGGRVLRPFTILPSTMALSDRERLRGEVFRSSHRLPSMTVDEYLEEERRRGNIITGGGQASADAPTTSELLELAAENDGTFDAEEAEEKKRLKDENWARFTDENAKGAGNSMNRG